MIERRLVVVEKRTLIGGWLYNLKKDGNCEYSRLLWMVLIILIVNVVEAGDVKSIQKQIREGSSILDEKIIQPGREIISESIRPASFYNVEKKGSQLDDYRIYRLVNMKPLTQYELRISYPAYSPTVFSIDILSEEELENRIKMIKTPKHSRKLLNIEKVMFKLDEEKDRKILTRFALVRAQVEAPSTFDNSDSLVYYNIGRFLRNRGSNIQNSSGRIATRVFTLWSSPFGANCDY